MHTCERLVDAESRLLDELELFVKRARENVAGFHAEALALDQCHLDLQEQVEASRVAIEDAHAAFALALRLRQEELLRELAERHKRKQQALVDTHDCIERKARQLLDAVQFAERTLSNGSGLEVLLVKRVISEQIAHLLASVPRVDSLDVSLKFVAVEQALLDRFVRENMGQFFSQKELKKHVRESERKRISLG